MSTYLFPEILLSDSRGIYIPRDAVDFLTNGKWSGFDPEDLKHLSDPENDQYWEAWERVYNSAVGIDDQGNEWTLVPKGDLFAFPPIEKMDIQTVIDFYNDDQDSIIYFEFTDEQRIDFLSSYYDDVTSENLEYFWNKYLDEY